MNSNAAFPPETVDVALKEWAGVVRALAEGAQTLLLRKGGIDEGTGGFRPEHPWFWLYPTAVHQAQQGLKPPYAHGPEPSDPDHVPLQWLANVVQVERLDDLATVDRLDALHAWTSETIHARFQYRQPGLWLMLVRVYTLPEPFRLPVTADHAGCRSWVPLPPSVRTQGALPVLDDARFAADVRSMGFALARATS